MRVFFALAYCGRGQEFFVVGPFKVVDELHRRNAVACEVVLRLIDQNLSLLFVVAQDSTEHACGASVDTFVSIKGIVVEDVVVEEVRGRTILLLRSVDLVHRFEIVLEGKALRIIELGEREDVAVSLAAV